LTLIKKTRVPLTDGADVLYNKFNVSSSSPSNNSPQHPNSDYSSSCVVATTGQWRVSRCNELHRVVCQSDMLTGIILWPKFYCLDTKWARSWQRNRVTNAAFMSLLSSGVGQVEVEIIAESEMSDFLPAKINLVILRQF